MAGAAVEATVELRAGRVRGRRDGEVWSFAGIPYARPPRGPLRWRAPRPPEPWDGVRSAREPAPIAPQPPPVPGMSVPGDPETQSEDCLYLDLWTPGLDTRRRPVMVWFHGGSFTGGTGSSLLYRGDLLAGEQGVVVVTCNYRLGALGFLAHPALARAADEPWGNWGLLDQVAVLRWVRAHVTAFGGDPDNVTVFGESAGAMSIGALLAMPAARGLFHRAILQSGPPYSFSAERGAEVAEDLMELLGMDGVDRDRLQSVPARDLVAAVAHLQERPPVPGELPLTLQPVVDGRSLPVEPTAAVVGGTAAPVPLLVGTTRDELGFFVLADPVQAHLDEEGLLELLARSVPSVPTADVVAAYRTARAERGEGVSPRDLWIAAGTDLVFRWPSLRVAASQRRRGVGAHVYLFTWETPAFGGRLGSCHGLDIPFVFGSVRDPRVAQFAGGGAEAEALSAEMRAAWASFARTGDPSHPTNEGRRWPAWEPVTQPTMVFGPAGGLAHAPRGEELSVWSRFLPLDPPAPLEPLEPRGPRGLVAGASPTAADGGLERPGGAVRPIGARGAVRLDAEGVGAAAEGVGAAAEGVGAAAEGVGAAAEGVTAAAAEGVGIPGVPPVPSDPSPLGGESSGRSAAPGARMSSGADATDGGAGDTEGRPERPSASGT